MSESQFTDKEVTYMATALQCMEGEIPRYSMLDKAKFSRLTGLTDNSAKTIWNKLRRKLADAQGGDLADPSTDEKTKVKKTPAKRKTAEKGENDETPTKKPRGGKLKAAEAVKEEDVDEEEQVAEEEAT